MSKNDGNLTKRKKTHLYTEAQLATLVSPRTREVFAVLCKQGAMSVGQLQESLDFHSKTLYYQVRKLVKAGLIVSETPPGSAEIFQPVAPEFSMPAGYQGIAYERLAAKSVETILRRQSRRFRAAAEASEDNPHLIDALHLRTASLKLSKTRFDRLTKEIAALLQRYGNKADEGEAFVEFVLVTAPRDSS